MKPPIKQGAKCIMNDGRTLYIHMVHRPGNGWGVSASEIANRDEWLSNYKANHYYPWHKFRKLAKEILEP